MNTKIVSLLNLMLFASFVFADPGDVITEYKTTDPGFPKATVDGDLIIQDTDGNNSGVPGLFVEGHSSLKGGLMLEGMEVIPLYVSGGASFSGNVDRIILLGDNDYSEPDSFVTYDSYGLSVLTIDRDDGEVLSHKNYSIAFDGSHDAMAEDLNALDNNVIVVITSINAWSIGQNGIDEDLLSALYRIGASSQISFNDYDGVNYYPHCINYVLIGIPGIGAGNGIEVINEDSPEDFSSPATTKTAEVSTLLIKAGPDGNYVPLGLGNSEALNDNGDGVFQRIGIGTSTPTAKLDVAGDASVTGDLNIRGTLTLGSSVVEITDPENAQSVDFLSLTTKAYVDNTVAQSSVIIKDDNTVSWGGGVASGDYSTAWGLGQASGDEGSTAWSGGVASGDYSTAWGAGSEASGGSSTAWGADNLASAPSSTAWGESSNASGDYSTAWGLVTRAESLLSTTLGVDNIGSFSFSDDGYDYNDGDTQWIDIDPLFEIGIGWNARANALTVLKDGRVALGKHTTLDALQTQPETVQIEGALKVGDYTTDPGSDASEGAIRFGNDGSGNNDLLGYVDGAWKSLTQSSESVNQLTIPDQNTVAVDVNSSGDVRLSGKIHIMDVQGDISMGVFVAD